MEIKTEYKYSDLEENWVHEAYSPDYPDFIEYANTDIQAVRLLLTRIDTIRHVK